MLQIKPKSSETHAKWLVENRYTFGTGEDNDFIVEGEGVHALQAALEVNGDNIVLYNLGGGNSIRVNDDVIVSQSGVEAGDEFFIGNSGFSIEDPKKERQTNQEAESDNDGSGWSLKAQNTALANKTYKLSGSKVIGRSQDCDICLYVVHLSRKHARLTVKGAEIEVEDLGSSNGTFINGSKIQRANARSGDEIAFDTLRFTLIGPNQSLESTHIRQAALNDATTMRPALSAQQLADYAEKKKASNKKPRPQHANQTVKATRPSDPAPAVALNPGLKTAESNEIRSNNLVGVALIGVILLVAVIAYIFVG